MAPAVRLLSILASIIASLTTALLPAGTSGSAYTFDDEFTGAANAHPSSAWSFQTGGNGWGNGELEQYTDRTENAHLDGNGHLAIVARHETYTGSDGISRSYTSARMYTTSSVTFGYAEARILVPAGQGLWPAFWSLGANVKQVDWPICGEIDALESYGAMSNAYGAIHAADYANRAAYAYNVKTSPSGGLAGTWHVFAVSKTSTAISWYVDGVKYATVNRSALKTGQDWPYDQAQYLLLDLAVGGTGGGTPASTVGNTATGGSVMLVDWVHAGAGVPPDAK